jgi:hypothetical protein
MILHRLLDILVERRDGRVDILRRGAGRNRTEPSRDLRLGRGHVDIPGQHQHRVVRAIMGAEPALHILQAGGVQIRHRSDRGVAIGMTFGEQRGKLRIFDEAIGIILAHALLVLDDAALRIELGLGDGAQQMAHAIGFEEERTIERAGRHRLEIVGAIEPGRAVPVGRADILQPAEERTVGILRSIEHQMLEEMREAGLAGGLVARADMIPDRYRDDRRLAVGGDDDAQPVGQRELLVRNIDHLDEIGDRCGLRRGHGERGSGQQNGSEGAEKRTDHAGLSV